MKVLSIAKNLVVKMMVEIGLKAKPIILTPALTEQASRAGRIVAESVESAPVSSVIRLKDVAIRNGRVLELATKAVIGIAIGVCLYEGIKYMVYLKDVSDAASITTI
jgi:hypothetical protein